VKERIQLRVNDEEHDLIVPVQKTLLEVLREDLALTGTKHGCELGECGTCTVLADGEPILSCLALAVQFQGADLRTVEGMAAGSSPHELQVAFGELGASQCGYCSPGMLVSAQALLERNPDPSRDEIREFLAGNLCRCTGYLKILEAIELAALRIREKRAQGQSDPDHAPRVPVAPQHEPQLAPVEGKRGTAASESGRESR
jgi:aerobic-type carbon monoxide dehydrogenase small subunit (CoxS/CutS family)